MMDPDKKVEEFNKKRSNIYQSSKHPHHFENEGGEYITADANAKEKEDYDAKESKDNNDLPMIKPKSLKQDIILKH